MASEKAIYWMAVGVMAALVLGNHFVSKYEGKCLTSKVQVTAGRVSGEATHLMAMAEVAMERTSTRFDRGQAAMAMAQVRLASIQTQLARERVACARLEGSRARMIVLQETQVPVVCPRQRIELVMPAPPAVPGADPI